MPDSDIDADAYKAYCENVFNWIFMPRDTFDSLASTEGDYFELDLQDTPLFGLTLSADFIVAGAQQVSPSAYDVEVYRYDPKDEQSSGPYNKDLYHVALDGQPSSDLFQIASGIPSTDFDQNLVDFSQRHVTLWKVPSSEVSEHHSSRLPPRVWVLLKST